MTETGKVALPVCRIKSACISGPVLGVVELTASADVEVTFTGSLRVAAALSDVPIRPDPGPSATELLTVTVIRPNGSPAVGASVRISSAPGDVFRAWAGGQVVLPVRVNLSSASVNITATADGRTASTTQVLREVTETGCTVNGDLVDVHRLMIDLLSPEFGGGRVLEFFEHVIDLLGKGISVAEAPKTPATIALSEYTITVPGASDIYATVMVSSDEHGQRSVVTGPYYTSTAPHPADPSVCVLTTEA